MIFGLGSYCISFPDNTHMCFQEGTGKTWFSQEVLCEDDCPFLKVEDISFSFGPPKNACKI